MPETYNIWIINKSRIQSANPFRNNPLLHSSKAETGISLPTKIQLTVLVPWSRIEYAGREIEEVWSW